MRAAQRFLQALTDDLVELELGPLEPHVARGTRAWVSARVSGAGDFTRFGLSVVGTVLAAAVRIRTARAYDRLPAARRRRIAARLGATTLPLASEYARVIRSLAVAYVYEARALELEASGAMEGAAEGRRT